jgi:hypothetical protein
VAYEKLDGPLTGDWVAARRSGDGGRWWCSLEWEHALMREMRQGGQCGVRRGEARRTDWGAVRCGATGAPFYRGQREAEASGYLQLPVMKEAFNATGYWGNEEGVCRLMGE